MEPTYPTDSSRHEAGKQITAMALAAIPGIGGILQVPVQERLARRLSERRERFFNGLADKISRLEGQIEDLAHLADDDRFLDAVTTAAQIADRTSQEEKIEMLRNAVVHSVMEFAPDADLQQLFFELIARLTPTHVRVLKLLDDPPGWFEREGITKPSWYSAGRSAIVEAGMPELSEHKDLVDRYASGLATNGLLAGTLSGMVSEQGLWQRFTSPLGRQFLAFIEAPENETSG